MSLITGNDFAPFLSPLGERKVSNSALIWLGFCVLCIAASALLFSGNKCKCEMAKSRVYVRLQTNALGGKRAKEETCSKVVISRN